jgi:hypothetical protein
MLERSQQRERIGATPRQSFPGQRTVPLRERIAQFGVGKFVVLMVDRPSSSRRTAKRHCRADHHVIGGPDAV